MCRFCNSGLPKQAKNFTLIDNNDSTDEWLFALLLLLGDDTRTQLSEMTLSALLDSAQIPALYRPAIERLAEAHAHAAYLGRRKAGVLSPFGQRDIEFGRVVAIEQAPYLQRFVEDLRNGRYTNDDGTPKTKQIEQRWQLYQNRVIGTANEAWALSQPAGAPIWWELGAAERHCTTCPTLAKNSPYTPETLPTYPRSGRTDCGVNCKCYLRNETGATSFQI